jgi:hypothetical protein
MLRTFALTSRLLLMQAPNGGSMAGYIFKVRDTSCIIS